MEYRDDTYVVNRYRIRVNENTDTFCSVVVTDVNGAPILSNHRVRRHLVTLVALQAISENEQMMAEAHLPC